ncbi:MAG: uroporphyrinogen-III C-methyltransferase [Elusimicrobiota bacterium]
MRNKGKVYLVGAGPGGHDLITVRGMRILEQADVVVYDYLADKSILKYAKPGTELICADELSPEKHSDSFIKKQKLINEILVKKARQGKKIVRLKNGDPFIFGRATEELNVLVKNNMDFAVIPGVTSASAAACFSGIPLTSRDCSSSVVFVTGHEAVDKKGNCIDWGKIALMDTVVLYMAMENLSQIAGKLIASGKSPNTPAAVVSNVTKINQKLVAGTLKNIKDKIKIQNISAPAIVIIGEVVKREKHFNWFRKAKKIIFTGLSPERFFEKGLMFHIPAIEIKPSEDYGELDNRIKKIEMIDWVIFTSRFGVYYFFERLYKSGYDVRALSGINIAAIGSSTANKLKEYGIAADMTPEEECSAGLLSEFKKINIKGRKILLPRSDIADKGLTDGLRKLGAEVFPCVAYRNVMPENLPDMNFDFFDEIIFSSPSTVRNFIKRYGMPPERIKIRAIGPVTKKEAGKYGMNV